MDIIMATSCTGTRNTRRGPSILSIPSVRLLGVVVSVITEEPITSITSLTAMFTAVRTPSLVTDSFHSDTSSSPGVRNKLNPTVISIRKRMAFIPFTMNRKGTWESRMTMARKSAATAYPRKWPKTNKETIYRSVPPSFTLGSSLWITDSV